MDLDSLYPSADEDLTELFWHDYKLLQKKQGFRFSVPSVLLAHFTPLKPRLRTLELGCGSGVISILLYAREQTLSLTACEIQPDQAALAKRNMALNHIPATILTQDLRTLDATHRQAYDLIVTNPPYYPLGSGILNPQNTKAAARHELHCTLSDIMAVSDRTLIDGGHLTMVHIPSRLDEILSLAQAHHLYPSRIRFVHPHHHDAAKFILIDCIKNRRQSLSVLPPLILYTPHGYTDTFNQIIGGTQ